jgi:lysophospholipase L1-like esterase
LEKRGLTILFQGDSITDANRNKAEESYPYLGHGYANLIAGRLGYRFPEANCRFINRGVGGNRVSDLYARWNEDAISLKPDIISILVGVNDAWRIMSGQPSGASDRFERVYRHLLDETREIMPDSKLVLCEPFMLQTGLMADKWEEGRKLLDYYGGVVRELANSYSTVFVPLQAPFDNAATMADASYWLHDGVHPTAAGHELIATEWLGAVEFNRLL